MRRLSKFEQQVDEQPHSLSAIWNSIIYAIKDGEKSVIIYHLPVNVKVALLHSDFIIENMQDGDEQEYYVVRWDYENTG